MITVILIRVLCNYISAPAKAAINAVTGTEVEHSMNASSYRRLLSPSTIGATATLIDSPRPLMLRILSIANHAYGRYGILTEGLPPQGVGINIRVYPPQQRSDIKSV